MDIEESTVGFVPLRPTDAGYDVLLVLKRKHHLFGYPKGHRERGEDDLQTGTRELMEESGCVVVWYWDRGQWTKDRTRAKLLPPLVREYPHHSGRMRRKTQMLFPGIVRESVQLQDHGEIERMEWFPLVPATAEVFKRDNERAFFIEHALPLVVMTMDIDESTVGFVPLRPSSPGYEVLLALKREHGLFGYPKGHREAGESDLQTGTRELMEESGCIVTWYWDQGQWTKDPVRAALLPPLIREYQKRSGRIRRKTELLFPGIVREAVPIQDHGEIERIEWFPLVPATAEKFKRENERAFFLEHVVPLASTPHPPEAASP